MYRRFAYALVFFTKVSAIICVLVPIELKSQDTVVFNAVEIKVTRIDLSELGKKTEHLDSSGKAQFKLNTLNDLLLNQSTIYIKSYGPGAIATTALRGGNASQTAILWNGFNLQNTMLGQTDLSMLPAFLFNDVVIEYGGSSSVWGSGAIAGSVQLNSNSNFGSGNFSNISIGTGSYGKFNSTAQVQFSKKRFFSSTKLYYNKADNNYKYQDTSDHEHSLKTAKHAEYASRGFMQEFKFLLRQNQSLSVSAWVHDNTRNLPASDPQAESKAGQTDQAIRLSSAWNLTRSRYHTVLKAAYFEDKLNYSDSMVSVYSKSKAQTVMIEQDNYFKWFKRYQFNLSANLLKSKATSNDYAEVKQMDRISLLAGNKFFFFKERLSAYVSLRFEYYSISALPVTGNVSLDYKLTPRIAIKFNSAKVYRQPTFNELYWQPGGNSQLKPEQGYTFEGEMTYTKKTDHFLVFLSMAAYSRTIQDWILWVPGSNGNPSPQNIQDVWSRGTESTWKLKYEKSKVRSGITFMTSYVLATIESSMQENDLSVGKQLIYTPRYTLNANLFVGYKQFDLFYFHQYYGYRFTASDNTSWLDPYHIASLRANYNVEIKSLKCLFFAACNNLYNQNYTVINQRPMPLRNYELGITLQLKH